VRISCGIHPRARLPTSTGAQISSGLRVSRSSDDVSGLGDRPGCITCHAAPLEDTHCLTHRARPALTPSWGCTCPWPTHTLPPPDRTQPPHTPLRALQLLAFPLPAPRAPLRSAEPLPPPQPPTPCAAQHAASGGTLQSCASRVECWRWVTWVELVMVSGGRRRQTMAVPPSVQSKSPAPCVLLERWREGRS